MTAPESSGASPWAPLSPHALSPAPVQALTRDNFRFSPGGTAAACVAGDGEGGLHLETWSFAGPTPSWWPLPVMGSVTLRMQPASLDDGCVLVSRGDVSNGNGSGAQQIVLVDGITGSDGSVCERVLGAVSSEDLIALRLLAGPGSSSSAHMAIAIGVDARGSTIWRLVADPPRLERLVEIPSAALLGGVWLDRAGTFLGVERVEGTGPVKTVAVDLRDGSWTPLLDVSKASNDHLLACHPGSGLLLVSTDAPGQKRLGWAKLGAGEPVRFPETLHRAGQPVAYPLTFDPDGQRVLLHFEEGVCSRLAVYTPEKEHLAPVEIPAGIVRGAACWSGGVLRFPFSTPAEPPGVATIGMGNVPDWSLAGSGPAAARTRWADAHIERLSGAAGWIEAIVYGSRDWQDGRNLLLALHGGPADAWRFKFDPLFQRLAAAGITVVAPNQRGSSGYGAAHTFAIRGAWGGPDLDDICCIAQTLAAHRRGLGGPGLMLLGMSYGAFLALLAASCEPALWSRCVAIAPFLSGSRLYQDASPEVQALIDHTGGREDLHDEVGPRDVLRLCHAIQARLLIVHGERDEMIPVSQSRSLRQRLLALGKREGADFSYLEIPDGRHDLATGAHTRALHERVVRFLSGGTPNHVRRVSRPQSQGLCPQEMKGGEYP